MTSLSLSIVRAQVERHLPGALTTYSRQQYEMALTGVAAIDRETGGIPKGALTQICAPVAASTGKTAVLYSALAQRTARGEFCALIDAADCFDPISAGAAGVELARLLWVRCGAKCGMRPLEQVFKAADILIQNGGFGVIAIDLGSVEQQLVKKIPLTTWFRFARVMEKLSTALLILVPFPAAQSCAALTFEFRGNEIRWRGSDIAANARVLSGVEFGAEVTRTRMRKPVQGVRPAFIARAKWA